METYTQLPKPFLASFFLNKLSLFDDAQRDILPFECIAEALFENETSQDGVTNARRLPEISVISIAEMWLSSSDFCRLSRYQLDIVCMSSSQRKERQPHDESVGTALHLTLCGVCSSRIWVALMRRSYFLYQEWPSYSFFSRKESKDHKPLFCGSARLSRRIYSSERIFSLLKSPFTVPT